jgi:hypothetical protein
MIQLVQLPLFLQVGPSGFVPYVAQHRRRNTMLMALPMLIELVASIWLWQIAALALVAVIWIVTFFLYIPAHSQLARGYNEAVIRRLIAWNWVRTLCWTARAGILLWIIAEQLGI